VEHPIWIYISRRHHEVASLHLVDFDLQPIPMLPLDLVDITASRDMSQSCSKFLSNAINCLGLLKVGYQQWNAETCHDYSDEVQCFIPVLKSLRVMEDKILHKFVDSSYMFVESPSFDVLIRLHTNLIEYHKLFWNGVTSSMLSSC
jgi:midasin